jgi:hypothetical protein
MSFPPSSAHKHKDDIDKLISKKVYNMCSNAVLLEAALAFHSPEPFHEDFVTVATTFNRILQCIKGGKAAQQFGDLHGNVHEMTVSTMLAVTLNKHLSCSSVRAHEMLGALATCSLPRNLDASLLWTCESPLVLESESRQGRMDVALALQFDSGFRGDAGKCGTLPVAFIELTRDVLKVKDDQLVCNSIGCMQYMRQTVSVFPLLSVSLNASKLRCTVFFPEVGGLVGRVVLCEVDVSVESVCRLLRMMMFWSVAVQPFISVATSFRVEFDRHVAISGAFCLVRRLRCKC